MNIIDKIKVASPDFLLTSIFISINNRPVNIIYFIYGVKLTQLIFLFLNWKF